MGIDPISFRWKENTGMETVNSYIGFSAQNVQEYIPEAVGEDSRGFLTLSDRPILATVVNSVKDQQKQMEGISGNVSELSVVNQDLILKTDENISTISELQDSIDDNFSKINEEINSQEDDLELLQAQLSDQGSKIKSIEDMMVIMKDGQDVLSAQVDINKKDIAYIKTILGLDGTLEEGSLKISGELEAEKVTAGTFSVKNNDDKTIGQATIKSGDKSVVVETKAVKENSMVFITPDQPVEIGVVSIKSEESFKIEINDSLEEDLNVNWWIVDEE
jgi:hypothetical protein